MFGQLELLTTFNIERETLCRWLLTVKKNYRPEVNLILKGFLINDPSHAPRLSTTTGDTRLLYPR